MNLIFLKGSSIVVTSCSEQVPLSQEGASSPCFYTMIRWIVILQKLPKLHWSPKNKDETTVRLFGPILPLATWDVPALPGWTVDASDVWTTTWSPLASFSIPPCSKFHLYSTRRGRIWTDLSSSYAYFQKKKSSDATNFKLFFLKGLLISILICICKQAKGNKSIFVVCKFIWLIIRNQLVHVKKKN